MRASRPASLSTPSPRYRSQIKVLVAGVDKDARGSVEASVLQAFAGRDPAEPWTVSLVQVGAQWSVTLSGPGDRFRNVSFSAQSHRLSEAIREAISREDTAPASAPRTGTPATPQSARSRIRDRHVCGSCQQALIVSYEGEPGEPKQAAPVACPHCWSVSRVEIGLWAADGRDYVAERA